MSFTGRRNAVGFAMVALAISITACSSSNDQETSTGTSRPASVTGEVNDHGTTDLSGSGASPTVEVVLDDNYFAPTFLDVAPGATVKLDLKNEGSRQHSVTTDDGVDVVVDPDQTGEVQLTAPDEGQLAFYCRFHRNTGMQGAVVVAGGGASSSSVASTTSTTRSSSGGGYGY
jgi:plastocyanin